MMYNYTFWGELTIRIAILTSFLCLDINLTPQFKVLVFGLPGGGHLGFMGQILKTDVRITILMVNLPEKVYSYIILIALVK